MKLPQLPHMTMRLPTVAFPEVWKQAANGTKGADLVFLGLFFRSIVEWMQSLSLSWSCATMQWFAVSMTLTHWLIFLGAMLYGYKRIVKRATS